MYFGYLISKFYLLCPVGNFLSCDDRSWEANQLNLRIWVWRWCKKIKTNFFLLSHAPYNFWIVIKIVIFYRVKSFLNFYSKQFQILRKMNSLKKIELNTILFNYFFSLTYIKPKQIEWNIMTKPNLGIGE